MARRTCVIAFTIALAIPPHADANPPTGTPVLPAARSGDGPTNHGVLLPPQEFDVPVKSANATRERHGAFTVTGGVYIIQPVFNTNPAFTVSGGGATRQVDFGHQLQAAPNIWLGYVSERGWGVRGRWFQFDHDANAYHASGPGETVRGISPLGIGQAQVAGSAAATSSLALNVFDLEGTCSFDSAYWSHLIGFGVRYTHSSQDYRATLLNPTTRIDVSTGHNFNGWGPCASLETKRRIGETGFAVYGQAHGTILIGHSREGYFAVNNGTPLEFSRRSTNVIPVGELEVGAEYLHNIGRARVFLQAGFVGQIWWGAGNASNLDALSLSSASDSNFGFLGLALRAGIRY